MQNLENNINKFENDIVIERLNAACKLIYKKYKSNQFQKVNRTVFSSYKFEPKN